MTETIRTVPATDKFAGMSEITIAGKSVACMGTGKHVEKAIRDHFASKVEKGERV